MKRIAVVLSCVFLAGCMQRLGDFSIVSTKNYRADGSHRLVRSNVQGQDLIPIICCFPLGIPNIESAIDDALNKNQGDYLQNATLYSTGFYIPLLFGQMGYVVKGDAWRIDEQHARGEGPSPSSKTDGSKSLNF